MQTVCYIARYMVKTGRDFDPAWITLPRLHEWKVIKEAEKDYKDPDDAPKLLKSDIASCLAFIEEFPDVLDTFTGTEG